MSSKFIRIEVFLLKVNHRKIKKLSFADKLGNFAQFVFTFDSKDFDKMFKAG